MYRLTARDRTFCEGTMAECQKTLSDISMMMDIVSIDYEIEEFVIISEDDK
jgi:hypothetical protein